MIYINLLPWRDSHSRRLQKKFFLQILIALSAPCFMVAMLWIKYSYEIQQMSQDQIAFELAHQNELNRMEDYDNHRRQEKLLLQRLDQVGDLVELHHAIPDMLSILTKNKLVQPIEYLAVDHHKLTIRGLDWAQGDAQILFQHLQSHPEFCQVSLLPPQQQTDYGTVLSFELQAEICDAENSG